MGDFESAARALAKGTLDYVHLPDGSDLDNALDGDAEMRRLALAVYAALGETPPERRRSTRMYETVELIIAERDALRARVFEMEGRTNG